MRAWLHPRLAVELLHLAAEGVKSPTHQEEAAAHSLAAGDHWGGFSFKIVLLAQYLQGLTLLAVST